MKRGQALLIVLLLTVLGKCDENNIQQNVIQPISITQLTSSNIDDFPLSKPSLLYFTMDSCQFCSQFNYTSLHQKYQQKHQQSQMDLAFYLVRHNPQNQHIFNRFKVDDTPTLLFVANGKSEEIQFFQYDEIGVDGLSERLAGIVGDGRDRRLADLEINCSKGISYWTHDLAGYIFTRKMDSFIFLINNQTFNNQMLLHYKQLKKSHPNIIFSYSDLSITPQHTVDLRRYLLGQDRASSRQHFYPFLLFLKFTENSTRPLKYYFQQRIMGKGDMEGFTQRVVDHVVNGKPYEKESSQLSVWYNSRKVDEQEDKILLELEGNFKYIKSVQQFNRLLDNLYYGEFFVFFSWRFIPQSQLLEDALLNWWEIEEIQDEQEFQIVTQLKTKFNLYCVLMHNVDVPLQVEVNYFPSLYFYDNNKKVDKLEGVTRFDQAKQYILGKTQRRFNLTSDDSNERSQRSIQSQQPRTSTSNVINLQQKEDKKNSSSNVNNSTKNKKSQHPNRHEPQSIEEN